MPLVIFTKSGVFASMKRKKKRPGDFVYVSSDSYGFEGNRLDRGLSGPYNASAN
jgi:hypothetical protein